MALSTEIRDEITTALRAAGIPAFASQPGTAPNPAVIIGPDSPYLTFDRVGPINGYTIGLRLTVQVQALDTAASLAILEALIEDVIGALPTGIGVSPVTAPRLESLGTGQGSAYTAEIPVTAHARKE